MKKHKHLSHAETAKVLDEVSPTFCTAKWLQPSLKLHAGTIASCCLAIETPIFKDDLEEDSRRLLNPTNQIHERKDLLEGRQAKNCAYCIRTGAFENSEPSERIYKSSPPWGHQEIARILEAGAEGYVKPSYLEVSFSSECQLKCLYCEGLTSSSIMRETKTYGPFPTYSSNNSKFLWEQRGISFFDEPENPYKEAFWEIFPDISHSLYVLRITGGEPLLHTDTYRVMKYLSQNPHPNLEFIVNTNLMVGQKYLDQFCEQLKSLKENHVKSVTIITSVESIGADAEFIRQGLNWDKFTKNLTRITKEFPEVKIDITATLNLFSLFNFNSFLDYISEIKDQRGEDKLRLSTYPLLIPSHFSIGFLGEEFSGYIHSIKNHLPKTKLDDYEKELILKTLDQFGTITSDDYKLRCNKAQFYWYFEEIKKRRDKDVLDYFPQLASFYLDCKKTGEDFIKYHICQPHNDEFKTLVRRHEFIRAMEAKPKQFVDLFQKEFPNKKIESFFEQEIKKLKKLFYILYPN